MVSSPGHQTWCRPHCQAGPWGPEWTQFCPRGGPRPARGTHPASQSLEWARGAARGLHGSGMRVYATDDLVGVQLGGAIKNVLAIAAGAADQMALGTNARAALITRVSLRRPDSVRPWGPDQHLHGAGHPGRSGPDLHGDLSRNRRVGMAMATGKTLDETLQGLGHVAEGVRTAPVIQALGEAWAWNSRSWVPSARCSRAVDCPRGPARSALKGGRGRVIALAFSQG